MPAGSPPRPPSLSEGGDACGETETTSELEPGLIERLRALVEEDGPVSTRSALPSFAGAGI
jgi:hypothetical protein